MVKTKALARLKVQAEEDAVAKTEAILKSLGCVETRTAYSDFAIPFSKFRWLMTQLAQYEFFSHGGGIMAHKTRPIKLSVRRLGGSINIKIIGKK